MNFKSIIKASLILTIALNCYAEETEQGELDYYLSTGYLQEFQVPSDIQKILSVEFEGNDYRNFKGTVIDINHDQIKDYIVSSEPYLCGTGGCLFLIVDGAQTSIIGRIFGNPLFIFKKNINGFPVVHAYSHSSAQSGSYNCYIYNGEKYVLVSSVFLQGDSVNQLFEKYKNKLTYDK